VVDVSVVADSNINNATNLPVVLVDHGDGPVEIPLDGSFRRRSGAGISYSASGAVDVELAGRARLAIDAEVFLVDQEGRAYDDASTLVAVGADVELAGGAQASVQVVAHQRWYGGTSASAGLGARGKLDLPAGQGRLVQISAEAREFSSDYGSDFDGELLGGTLALQAILDPATTGAAGLYARRYWFGADAYSNFEIGAYAGISRYVSPDLAASVSAGISHTRFDAPLAFLSPEARRDWRFYGSLSARLRRPLVSIFYPHFDYTYSRIESSVAFYDTDRHVLRLGLEAPF